MEHSTTFLKRLGALSEVAFVLLAGTVIAFITAPMVGIPNVFAQLFAPDNTSQSMEGLAGGAALQLCWQYGVTFLLILIIGAFKGRLSPRRYALSFGGRSLGQLVAIGLTLGAVGLIPINAVFVLDDIYDLGAGTPFWDLMAIVPWDGHFWMLMAVASFGLVPILEELAVRGYAANRLGETFSIGASSLLTAFVFAVAHAQYLSPNLLLLSMLGAVLFFAICAAYVTLRTGSILPAILAHVMINIPLIFEARIAAIAFALIVLFLARNALIAYAGGLARSLVGVHDKGQSLLLLLLLIVFMGSIAISQIAILAWLVIWLVLFIAFGRGRAAKLGSQDAEVPA